MDARQIIRVGARIPVNLLTIGGSDPSGASGIQGDVRTLGALGASCATAVTAVTAQNTGSFGGSEPVSPGMIGGQIRSVLADVRVSGIKIGMVWDEDGMEAVRRAVSGAGVPVVADPVARSTTGGRLTRDPAAYARILAPVSDIMTPNLEEARAMTGTGDPARAAGRLLRMGARGVIVTGVRRGGSVRDLVFGGGRSEVAGGALRGAFRGAGGVHSAALLHALASGDGPAAAARRAWRVARDAIVHRHRPGAGLPVADAGAAARTLGEAARSLAATDWMHSLIPECQTNFVYGIRPKGPADVLGIEGRMVRAGRSVIMAGAIRYGGSAHVARALVAASSVYPSIRSAMNVRYGAAAAGRAGLVVAHYDRGEEPPGTGSSVSWGVEAAASRSPRRPDAVCHAGAHGKEPMMIILGTSPADVAAKAALIHKYRAAGRGP